MFVGSGNIPNLLNRIMHEFSDTSFFFVINVTQKLGCDRHIHSYIFLSTLNFSPHSLKYIFPPPQDVQSDNAQKFLSCPSEHARCARFEFLTAEDGNFLLT